MRKQRTKQNEHKQNTNAKQTERNNNTREPNIKQNESKHTRTIINEITHEKTEQTQT